jgi:hypothetical protein
VASSQVNLDRGSSLLGSTMRGKYSSSISATRVRSVVAPNATKLPTVRGNFPLPFSEAICWRPPPPARP